MRSDFDDLPLFAGRQLRDQGIALVDANSGEWKEYARALVLEVVPIGWEGTGEDVRNLLTDTGLPEPHSPNCWGSLTLWCVRNGVLQATGAYSQMRDPKSHARETKVYRRSQEKAA